MLFPVCQGYGCGRRPMEGGCPFCRRCWARVPADLRLALDDHHRNLAAVGQHDSMGEILAWQQFLRFSMRACISVAAHEAYQAVCVQHLRHTPLEGDL